MSQVCILPETAHLVHVKRAVFRCTLPEFTCTVIIVDGMAIDHVPNIPFLLNECTNEKGYFKS